MSLCFFKHVTQQVIINDFSISFAPSLPSLITNHVYGEIQPDAMDAVRLLFPRVLIRRLGRLGCIRPSG